MLPHFILMAIAIALTWWWVSRVNVTPTHVAAMATRIAFPGGVHLHDPDATLATLKDPDEIVIPYASAILVIDYPLTIPANIEVEAPIEHGFTRAELVKMICEQYATVYETEEATAHTKTLALAERTGATRHRNRTDGLYGIWGHDLHDLVMTSMRWSRSATGKVRIELHVVA